MRVVAEIAYNQGVLIGRGQNSEGVFLCVDEQFGGQLAVKVVDKNKLDDPAKAWDEACAMYGARHDNVVQVQYGCNQGDLIMLAMPYMTGGPLSARIKDGPLGLLECLRVGQGILSGLHQIHAAMYVHWDLKPSNVLFDEHDVPKVSDFGQTQTINPLGLSAPPATVYDAATPPEWLLGQPGSALSDVYQAGLTLYRMVNGDPFYNNQYYAAGGDVGQMTVDGEFPERTAYYPHVPRYLRGVINKALEVDPTKRHGTAIAFAAALGRRRPAHDWQVTCQPSGEIEWRSQRNGSPDLVVRRMANGKKWNVRIHTERIGQSPRATMKNEWEDSLTDGQCFPCLRQVFTGLG